MNHAEPLSEWAVKFCPDANRQWLIDQLMSIQKGGLPQLVLLFASAGRKLGSASPGFSEVERQGFNETERQWSQWRAQDLGRVAALLLATSGHSGLTSQVLLEDLYFRGAADEKIAVLLALPFLDSPGCYLELAVEACRTNTISIFETIACKNSYPAAHFSEEQFNQLVLKTLFLELNVEQIVGLKARISLQLIQDLCDYKSERVAAGRNIPPGLGWILELAKTNEII